jgi:hypothetical protein
MWSVILLTGVMLAGVVLTVSLLRREEIAANWSKYRSDPFFLFAAPLFKPDDDPRSRIQFAVDNFNDVVGGIMNDVFLRFLQPVFKVFTIFLDGLYESLNGLYNMRALFANMFAKWNSISDIFMRRFAAVANEFRKTFIKLFHAMQKTMGVATSSIFAGISTIQSILSMFDFMMTVAIVILISLIVLVIFFFFILAPFVPLILTVVGIIAATAMGGAVGGMAETFCFAAGTAVQMRDGRTVGIEEIRIGDCTATGGVVRGVMEFAAADAHDIYDLYGIHVSGTHIVYGCGDCDGVDDAVHVAAHPAAIRVEHRAAKLYCLITSDHKIPVLAPTTGRTVLFADWEELSDMDDLREWNRRVYEMLNGGDAAPVPPAHVLESEAVVSGGALVATVDGPCAICEIRPGAHVLDASGVPTRVVGVVQTSGDEVRAAAVVSAQSRPALISAGAWIYDGARWTQPAEAHVRTGTLGGAWYSLFTESGTFMLDGGIAMRDFTDVGSTELCKTYNWVLGALGSSATKFSET